MPPFPWHLGGQQFHNLLRKPSELQNFCKTTGASICLDTSHMLMSSKYFGFDFEQACLDVAPYTMHVHLADAKGVDQEGVKLGKGDLDLRLFSNLFKKISNMLL